jgi:plasmid stabilization system protein ParE
MLQTYAGRDHAERGIESNAVRNYLVFYWRKNDEVEVLRVLHGARDIRSILGAE